MSVDSLPAPLIHSVPNRIRSGKERDEYPASAGPREPGTGESPVSAQQGNGPESRQAKVIDE